MPSSHITIPIPPNSLLGAGAVASVLVFPGRIDSDRLEKALRKIPSSWPTTISRYVTTPGKTDVSEESQESFALQVSLDDVIPFSVTHLTADHVFPSDHVQQESVREYLHALPDGFQLPNSGHPLVTVRLTLVTPTHSGSPAAVDGEVRSVIGLSFSHVVFDAFSASQFMADLSRIYQSVGDELSAPPPPVYPTDEDALDQGLFLSNDKWKAKLVPEFECSPWEQGKAALAKLNSSHTLLRLAFTAEEIATLKGRCRDLMSAEAYAPSLDLSATDVLTSFWIGISEFLGIEAPVETVTQPFNYRPLKPRVLSTAFASPRYAMSAVGMRRIELPPAPVHRLINGDSHSHTSDDREALQHRVAQIAFALRRSVAALKEDGDMLDAIVLANAYQLTRLARERAAMDLNQAPGHVYVNSTVHCEWIADFGFPADQVAFHTASPRSGTARLYRANPAEQRASGSLVEMAFYVPKDVYQSVAACAEQQKRLLCR